MTRAPIATLAFVAALGVAAILLVIPSVSAGGRCDPCEEELIEARQAWASFLISERTDWAETFDAAALEQREFETCYENNCPGSPTYIPVDADALATRCERFETMRNEASLRLRAWRASYEDGELDVDPAAYYRRAEELEEDHARWRLRVLACDRMVRQVGGLPRTDESPSPSPYSGRPRLLLGTTYGLFPQDIDTFGLPETTEIILPNDPEPLPPILLPNDPEADIAVDKTADAATALPGGEITHTITVRNLGPSTATEVVVRDTLPAAAQYSGFEPSKPGVLQRRLGSAPGTVDFKVPVLEVGETVEIRVMVFVPASFRGSFTNRAALLETDQIDPNGANDSGAATTEVGFPMCQPFGIYGGSGWTGGSELGFGASVVDCPGGGPNFTITGENGQVVECDSSGFCGNFNLFNGNLNHIGRAIRRAVGEFLLTFYQHDGDLNQTGVSRSETFRFEEGGSR